MVYNRRQSFMRSMVKRKSLALKGDCVGISGASSKFDMHGFREILRGMAGSTFSFCFLSVFETEEDACSGT